MSDMNHCPVVKVRKFTGVLYALSNDVADFFGREHKHVIDAIEKCLTEQPNLVADFSAAKRNNRGRHYKCYEMTRRGFTYLVLGFTGKKANQFKLAYIDQFEKMEAHLRDTAEGRSGSLEMCRLLEETRKEMGKETQAHHYINEHNMIYSIVCGECAKQLKEDLNLSANQCLIDVLPDDKAKEVATLRNHNAQLLTMGMAYHERKHQLMRLHESWARRLAL